MSKQRKSAADKDEDKIQALLLADSFDQRFTPITLEAPRVCVYLPLHHAIDTNGRADAGIAALLLLVDPIGSSASCQHTDHQLYNRISSCKWHHRDLCFL
jgi:hypothetical protein